MWQRDRNNNHRPFHPNEIDLKRETTGCGKFMFFFYLLLLIAYVLFSTGKIDVLYQKFETFVYEIIDTDSRAPKNNAVREPLQPKDESAADIKIFDKYFLDKHKKPADDEIVNHFIKNNPYKTYASDRNILHLMAIDNRPYPIVKLGIRFPQFLNAKDSNGICPLSLALLRSSHNSVDAFLMFPNINLKIVDNSGYTVLHYAARSGHFRAASMALEKGVSPNEVSVRGLTPLLIAAQSENLELVELMLKYGGDPMIKAFDKNCFDFAKSNPNLMQLLYTNTIRKLNNK
ncbi:MAG: ankyrin repeat domain-containing protein [Candidatus Riflebacteria bacterium]|nr:ankyrin repeat domain-containing protein [Candidatus Riflebacteria bacterium]